MSNLARHGGYSDDELGINLPNGDCFAVPKDSYLADLDLNRVGAITGDACNLGQFDSEFDFNPGDEVAVNFLATQGSNCGVINDNALLEDFLPGGFFDGGLHIEGEFASLMPGDMGQASGLACNRASHFALPDEFSPYKDW